MISVVVPVYNNGDTVDALAQRVAAALAPAPYELIFVNDGSRDESIERLRAIAAADPNVRVISLCKNFGQHPAMGAGFEHARGDSIVLMDADLQDHPEDIPTLIDRLRDDVDIVYTCKRGADAGLSIRVTSLVYHHLFSRIVGVSVPPNIGTFRAFNRKVLAALLRYRERSILYGPLMFFMGFRSIFIEVEHHARPSGKSAYSFGKRLALAMSSLMSYTDIPHRLSLYVGGILFAGSVVYGIAVTVQYLLFGSAFPAGFTLILLVLILMLGNLMMTLGIIGSYLFRVYLEVLDRPRYLIAEKINFESRVNGAE